MIEFTVEHKGERLDKLLVTQVPELTRSQLQALIKDGNVTVDGVGGKPALKLRGGESIRIVIAPPPPAELTPESMSLEVLYEDAQLAVLNKPAGLVVHPGAGIDSGTLANGLLARYPELAGMKGQRRQGIVHRLDKYTSGVLVIARTETALNGLMQQFQSRTVEKRYIALLEAAPSPALGRIDQPIARDPSERIKMAVIRTGRPSVTEYQTLEVYPNGMALVSIRLLTGRTHQIRVHFAHLGCPVVGDTTYGLRKQRVKLGRTFLHAAVLAFDHPGSGARMRFEAPLPTELTNVLSALRNV
ncbi:MAG: RluA family pseudouridine synthase [Chloroflexi bacterium]|nr:RluA family pseudouridine synthase [Chloroflexota bacterium]